MRSFSLSNIIVVIPTYNNPKTIAAVVEDVLQNGYEVIVVDDGSDTPVMKLIEQKDTVMILRHESNMGKGQAILTGAKEAKKRGYDSFVSMDGDGQHLANQIQKLITAQKDFNYLVVGARDFNIKNIPAKSKIGRAFHNFWIYLNSGYKITDSLTGFRLYPVSIDDISFECKRFDFEVEVLVKHYWKTKSISDTIIECYYPTPQERVSHFDNYNDTIALLKLHVKLLGKKILGNKE